MALFLIERNFAEALELDAQSVDDLVAVNDDVGVRWVYSFLSADRRKTYCLYEAESEEAIVEAARRNNIPADVIVRVDYLRPTDFEAASTG
jgi:Nickel responsive protein SCO4226-like